MKTYWKLYVQYVVILNQTLVENFISSHIPTVAQNRPTKHWLYRAFPVFSRHYGRGRDMGAICNPTTRWHSMLHDGPSLLRRTGMTFYCFRIRLTVNGYNVVFIFFFLKKKPFSDNNYWFKMFHMSWICFGKGGVRLWLTPLLAHRIRSLVPL